MYVDDIVKDNKLIHVTDTLVLHIDTISSFEKLIPFICGPFTRLTIHGGDIKLDQLKRLMRDTVRKVEITAQIELKRDEYDDAVRLITQHVRGVGYVFNLESTPQLITKVKPAVESDFHAQDPRPDNCNKKQKRSQSTMTNFAPINNHRTCPEAEKEVRDQLYITDNKMVYEWASKKTFIFRIFKLFYWLYRWACDGFSLAPTSHSLLSVDEVIKMGRPIYVTETLVLHCRSIASFRRLIPHIWGPYTRIVIHGDNISRIQATPHH
uniref:Band_3_cyto domain-containing protein n=1 Tax=Panagrellus redivivus TaxID=6233 RepID=A0A7E4W9D0_PANRE